MPSAAWRNADAAARERRRRELRSVESGGGYTLLSPSPEWDGLFGSLRDQEEAANAAGLNYRVNLGSIGRDGYEGMDPAGRPNNRFLAQTLAADDISRRLQAMNAERDLFNAQRQQGILNDLDTAYINHVMAGEMAPPIAPHMREDVVGPSVNADPSAPGIAGMASRNPAVGNTYRLRPMPQTQREAILNALPRGAVDLRAQYMKRFADEDLAAEKIALEREKLQAAPSPVSLTDDGVDIAARNYLQTGVLPTLGMGDKTSKQRIIDRAAQMAKEGGGERGNIAANKADYRADSGSLAALQKQRDAIGAFEDTALKNLDVFIGLAKKIPDTGSPAFNQPLRSVSERMFGNEGLAAYNAARRTVIPEFAKILANPGLSGQLSDSARHEVEEVLSGNATLKQTLAVANLLKQDAANRRDAMDAKVREIRGRISGQADKETPEQRIARLLGGG